MWRAAFAIKVLVTAALFVWLATKIDTSRLLSSLGESNLPMLIAGTAVLALQPMLGAARWQVILRCLGVKLPNSAVTQWTYVGVFFSQVLPASVGGDALRIWLACRAGAAVKPAVNSIVLDRVAMLLSLAVFIAISVPWFQPALFPLYPVWLIQLLTVGGGAAGVGVLLLGERLPMAFLETRPGRWVASLSADTRSLFVKPRFGALVALLSIAGILNLLIAVWMFALAFGAKASAVQIMALLSPVIMVSILPISIGGWGTREMAMVTILGTAGIASETAFLTSIWLGLGSILMTLPGAFFHFFLAVPVKPIADAPLPAQELQGHGPG